MDSFEYVCTAGGIDEFKHKKNGMRVLLMEESSAPVATVMVTYHVGSRNEAIGYTGSTHLLEHLMFKGSKDFNKEKGTSIWTVLQNVGATINATTWNDRTNYFELLPKEHIEQALQIEADRMRHAFIREEDRKSEMTVVRNEFERGENDPHEALDKALWATAYQAHPYHHSTIGWRSDIENVPIARLKEFYDTFYWPNNATLTVIGDFERKTLFAWIDKYFGALPSSSHPIPDMYTTEPPQEGQRRVIVRRAGKVGIVGIAHKSPPALHEDAYSLRVLANILSSGKSSRLYKAIVDKGLATAVSVDNSVFKDNGLFVTYVVMTPGTKHEDIENIVLQEYEKVKKEGVTAEEVKKTQAEMTSQIAFSRDGTLNVARYLNEAIAVGDWKLYTYIVDKINGVTPNTVQAVANKIIQEDFSTVGYFIPKSEESAPTEQQGSKTATEQKPATSTAPVAASPSQTKAATSTDHTKTLAERIQTVEPVKGLKLYLLKTGLQDVVTIQGSLLGGEQFSDRKNPLIAKMTGRMLDQGTKKHTKFEIAELLSSVGAALSFSVGMYHVRFSAKCLKKDINLVFQLLAEQLQEPLFSAEDFETVKKREIGRLTQQKQSTRERSEIEFLKQLYPPEHPNFRHELDEEIKFLESMTIQDLQQHHERVFGLGNFSIVAVGDVESENISEALKAYFSGWKNSPLDQIPARTAQSPSAFPLKETSSSVFIKDKSSCDVLVGQPVGIDRNHEDYIPLFVAQYVLGGNFSSRLMSTVRDEEGLTYGIYSYLGGAEFNNDGYFAVWATFAPSLLGTGSQSTKKQLVKWATDGVSRDELKDKITSITGSYKVRLATTGGLADSILANIERGKPLSYLDEYPKLVEKVSAEQVNQLLKKYVQLDKFVTVVAGTFDESNQPNSKL